MTSPKVFSRLKSVFTAVLLCLIISEWYGVQAQKTDSLKKAEDFLTRGQQEGLNNWAVLVCTSRFWFNYRHIANVLSMYHTVKRLGIPDSQIILMLADDVACDGRNGYPATVFNRIDKQINLYGENVQVDYRGYDVTVENFTRLMTGRTKEATPRTKKLLSDDKSNILLYMTGHGGEEFLKFQDSEEVTSHDLSDMFEQMKEQKRFNEIFYMIDTCQAASLYNQFKTPHVLAAGSSLSGENSYSYATDRSLGVALIDRWTYYLLEYLEKIDIRSAESITDMLKSLSPDKLLSTPDVRADLYARRPEKALVTDFFGFVQRVKLTDERSELIERQDSRTGREGSKTKIDSIRASALTKDKQVNNAELRDMNAINPVPDGFWIATMGLLLGIVLWTVI